MNFTPKPNRTIYFDDRTETLMYDPSKATEYDPYAGYKLTVTYRNGQKEILDGLKGYASATDLTGMPVATDIDPVLRAQLASKGFSDPYHNAAYNIGRGIGSALTSKTPTWFGQTFVTPNSALLGGAGIGATLGALGNLLYNTAVDDDSINPIIGGLLGAGLGAGLGYLSNKGNPLKDYTVNQIINKDYDFQEFVPVLPTQPPQDQPASPDPVVPTQTQPTQDTTIKTASMNSIFNRLIKCASVYRDPRNFILEKLQRAKDISLADKALLASKVRDMSIEDAEQLEKRVREALGIGVGQIIADYMSFNNGTSVFGTLLGNLNILNTQTILPTVM